jgi:hypothetical protein
MLDEALARLAHRSCSFGHFSFECYALSLDSLSLYQIQCDVELSQSDFPSLTSWGAGMPIKPPPRALLRRDIARCQSRRGIATSRSVRLSVR